MAARSEDLERIAIEGYVYLFPLVLMDATRRATANHEGLLHFRAFPPGDFRDVVRPNFDTLYSMAWLDLTDGPQVVSITAAVDRYFMLPLLDMWTDVFAVIGTRTTGGDPGEYAIVPPGWQGDLPEGMSRIDAPTPVVWLVGRTQTNGPDDYPAVHRIQDGFRVRPLGADSAPPAVDFDAATGGADPLAEVQSLSGQQFFDRAAQIMATVPPHVTDQPVLARLERLGFFPGQPFAASDPEIAAAAGAAPAEALRRMSAVMVRSSSVVNGWAARVAGIGVYGTDYLFRAAIALVGLGANLPEDAIYPVLLTDENGEPPVGERTYVLHFDRDALPPVDAFWSLTMYDGDGFTTPNPLNRYALGDRDPLRYNEDGSLDIVISHAEPGDVPGSNWLPAPPGPLGLTLRFYGPQPALLEGVWGPPPLRSV